MDVFGAFVMDQPGSGNLNFLQVGGVNSATAGNGLVANNMVYHIGDDSTLTLTTDPDPDPFKRGPTLKAETNSVRIHPNYGGQTSITRVGSLNEGSVSGARVGTNTFLFWNPNPNPQCTQDGRGAHHHFRYRQSGDHVS